MIGDPSCLIGAYPDGGSFVRRIPARPNRVDFRFWYIAGAGFRPFQHIWTGPRPSHACCIDQGRERNNPNPI
jgi:hypothetical protein